MRLLVLGVLALLIVSCSEKKQEFVGDSLVAPSAMSSRQQPSNEDVTEEPDTLDIQDTAIVVYEPTTRQQEKLLAKYHEYVEYLSDFEHYTMPLAAACQEKISIYYTSARFLRIQHPSGVELFDTKAQIHRKLEEDAGVIFVKGSAKPMTIKDVTDDYSQDIKKFFGVSIQTDTTQ